MTENKTNQKSNFSLPKGKATVCVPNGHYEIADYGKKPIGTFYNSDRAYLAPKDPPRKS